MQVEQDRLLTTREAAKFLNVSEAFLERDRWAGARIPFVRVGARAVRYELSSLKAYVKAGIRQSTSDTGRAGRN
ncbi:MAG: helix-turn-helix domain-containing protein [Candidatus Nitrohelix vancouverensis]|uniref:Helix-turn-helix domain-containing protein n=1 Tax=Candidatus Nitrohelix vancouverensis TaxID=2705534 RepID=A0A7T0G2C0_9BACT|nr:MAG: helix-turn-helix domain-containing protein [Candidatus Nitrohelix vancouverensis]